jgi:hypothetical protein
MKRHLLQTFRRSRSGQEQLWKIWWICGVPVAWITSAMVVGAEVARVSGHLIAADWLDVSRLFVYILWAQLAWRCAHNVNVRLWTPLARFALSAGFVLMLLV